MKTRKRMKEEENAIEDYEEKLALLPPPLLFVYLFLIFLFLIFILILCIVYR
jgi:hypothetical protein